jgi:hypothetical protein
MHLSDGDRARLRWASLLHDIGKLVVPPEILTKPAALNDAEMSAIRRHPEEGEKLIGPLRAWLGEWGDAVIQHHERYDGTGYPRGLAGDQISLAGRIVAVADSYEVMTAARPYRKSISVSAAREELVKFSGTQFDPLVVRAFLNISMGRLWRVVGFGSWVAQLSLLGWIQQLGWNWGAAALASGTTAIAVVVPGVVPRSTPFPVRISQMPVLTAIGPSTPAPRTTATGKPNGSSHTTSGGNSRGVRTPRPSPTATPSPVPPTAPSPSPSPTPRADPPPVVVLKGGGVDVMRQWDGSGSFVDASAAGTTYTAVVRYGDGSGWTHLALHGNHFVLAHVYPASAVPHTYTVTVVVTDNHGVSGQASITVTIV